MGVIPVILSGGSGTRLWPLSRKQRPKQFLHLGQQDTFFQATVKRCTGALFDNKPIVVAANDHRFLVAENLNSINRTADILLEPAPRNSCAAIIAGCLQAVKRDPDAVVVVLAADHLIEDIDGFQRTVSSAVSSAHSDKLVTFGIRPDFPATGYGYICKEQDESLSDVFRVKRFVEKPDAEAAATYMAEGYLWNSGNFLFKASFFLEEAKKFAPDIVDAVLVSHEGINADLDFLRLDVEAFRKARSISVDYAIMEKTDNAVVVPADHDWSDIGNWETAWKTQQKTDQGNAIFGDGKVMDGTGNLVHSQGCLTTVVGVNDLTVVTTPDAVLVVANDSAERVKHLVSELESAGRTEATEARKAYRPWGNYDVIDAGDNYKVKRLEIKPGGVLSLQKHRHRSEHWVVVAGAPEITIGNSVRILKPNQSVYIPADTVHRLANYKEKPAVLIEVQTGSYLGEDDIIRLDDQYNRCSD